MAIISRRPLLYAIIAGLSIFGPIAAGSVTPRGYAGCTILNTTLYCYGGSPNSSVTTGTGTTLNEHIMLDLTKSFSLNQNVPWQEVPNPSQFNLEPNAQFGMTSLNDTSYMIAGGVGYTNNVNLTNPSLIFHANTKQWAPITNVPFPQRIGSSLLTDNQGRAWLWGGKQSMLDANPIDMTMYMYVPKTNTWTLTTPIVPASLNTSFSFAGAARGKQPLYYVGGSQGGKTVIEDVLVFDPSSITWVTISMNSQILQPREMATLTYLPNTNQMVFYGGRTDQSSTFVLPADNYCWLYDITQNQWTDKTSSLGSNGPGALYGHSAVLFRKRYLFIVFGFNGTQQAQSSVSVLDTTTWQWLASWSSVNSGGSSTGKTGQHSGSSLSTGALAGIVVGAIALTAVLAGGIVGFILYRRKRAVPKFQQTDSSAVPQQSPGGFKPILDSYPPSASEGSTWVETRQPSLPMVPAYDEPPRPFLKPDESDSR